MIADIRDYEPDEAVEVVGGIIERRANAVDLVLHGGGGRLMVGVLEDPDTIFSALEARGILAPSEVRKWFRTLPE
ncbi:hypothetical protein [Paracraurococcus lichenis]|uniref:Uncharacterized protein n=1 Tax=Paracraurococcus lichenis TaxID=3064888 RepID=A0ABT9ECK6_9PROT|nr:hypothetical protein [Paracraurococcus sp. LOR1-02]MDO9713943.1 hypothetical protein [Paracraurococcus sp. LOR1-02]